MASQGSLDDGVMLQIEGSQEEVGYGSVEVLPLLFQDDVAHDSGSLREARVATYRMDMVMKTKQLDLNREKTVIVLMGKQEQKEKIREELVSNPLMCGEFAVKEVEAEKWLGD